MNEITHLECGGTVVFERRALRPGDEPSTVLVCKRCEAVISSTDELHPQGAVCGVVFPDVPSQRSAA